MLTLRPRAAILALRAARYAGVALALVKTSSFVGERSPVCV